MSEESSKFFGYTALSGILITQSTSYVVYTLVRWVLRTADSGMIKAFGNIGQIQAFWWLKDDQSCGLRTLSGILITWSTSYMYVVYKLVRWVFIRPSLDGTYYGMALSVRPSVRPSVRSSVRPTVSTKKHRCKWRIFFKFCTLVCLGVPSINLLFVLSYLIKYAHNSIISDFSIFGFHRVIF